MLALLEKLKNRLYEIYEINDGSFEIDDKMEIQYDVVKTPLKN